MNSISFMLSKASDYCSFSSDYSNELFLYYILPMYEKEFGTDFPYKKILINTIIKTKSPIIDFFISIIVYLVLYFFFLIFGFFIFIYLFVFNLKEYFLQNKKNKLSETLMVFRNEASLIKIKSQKDFIGSSSFVDSFFYKNINHDSLYIVGNLYSGILFFNYLSKLHYDIYSFVKDILKFRSRSKQIRIIARYFFRIPFKVTYQVYLDFKLVKSHATKLISGEKEDRYAMCQKRLCKLRNVKMICYPHGLEYGFRTPKGVAGDVFYCNTKKSQKILQSIYSESSSKFFYTEEIANLMLGDKNKKSTNINGIVFFPESRDLNVNRDIMLGLNSLGLDYFVKLHPLDSESNYSDLISDEKFTKDLESCLFGKVCIARKSTILLEAKHRGSIPCSLIINDKDKVYVQSLFPALSSEGINIFYDFDSLEAFLRGNEFV
jgi:hypothetical protein